jgi:hypothetical protein
MEVIEMPLQNGEVHIHDLNWESYISPGELVDGEIKAKGLIPRNYDTHPQGCYASAPSLSVDMPLIPRSEWSERIKDMEANQSRLSDIRLTGNNGGMIPSLDQNGKGYCWAHSTTGAVMMLRAVMGEPYVGLSAYAVACVIKQFRDEGGWGAESLDFIMQRGVPSEAFWPMRSMSRSNDNATTWANAALHKVTDGWVDLQAAQYDRKLTFDQTGTLLLSRCSEVGDFNWWGHSVCLLDLVDGSAQVTRVETGKLATLKEYNTIWGVDSEAGGYGIRILNSWGDSWSDRGMGVLSGSKAIPNGAVAPRATVPSTV